MKFFGHPIHPMVIHFPTALLPMDLALGFIALQRNDSSLGQAAFYCLVAGVLIGFVAKITGLVDLIAIPKANKQALALGLYHAFLNGLVILVFAGIAYKTWKGLPGLPLPSTGTLILKAILIITLFVGNYMGGRLIYNHYVGLNLNAK